jgi:molybdopterin-dependent oxidoreductase alpha subunit
MAPRIGPEPAPPELTAMEKFLHAIPFGVGIRHKPRYYLDYWKSMWASRTNLPFALKILKHGLCDGCSLGPAGDRDDVANGTHLCSLRLKELRYRLLDGIKSEDLGDVRPLVDASADEVHGLGRIPTPLVRHRDENGLATIPWDEALDEIAEHFKKADLKRTAWFAGARTLTNEGAFAFREVSRKLGSPNLDSSVRFGYGAAVGGIADVFGVAAPTSSFKDLLGSDLIVLWGVDPSATHPVMMKYLALAKEQGSRIAAVDPRREERLVKYWVPSLLESSAFGTRLLDDHYAVRKGGDIAFMNGVMKTLQERNGFDLDFLHHHAAGLDEASQKLRESNWKDLEKGSGVTSADMARFAGIYSSAKSAMFVFSTGLTRQRRALESVRSLATLAAVRGMVGKKRCGLLPLGQSGEQGAVDLDLVPGEGGMTAPGMIRTAQEGKLDFLCTMSGNLFDAPVDQKVVSTAIRRIGVRVHIGSFLDSSMVLPPADVVYILPSATREETPGGCTSTSGERRIRFGPEVPGQRIREARPEWQIPVQIAQRIDLSNEERFPWTDAKAVRADLEKAVPRYKGIAGLQEEGRWIQWGGERLHEKGTFESMPGGKCRLMVQDPPPVDAEA